MRAMLVQKKYIGSFRHGCAPKCHEVHWIGMLISPNGYGAEAFGRVFCTNRWGNWAGRK